MDSTLGCIGVIKKKIVSGICSVPFLAVITTKSCISCIAIVVIILSCKKDNIRFCRWCGRVVKAQRYESTTLKASRARIAQWPEPFTTSQ